MVKHKLSPDTVINLVEQFSEMREIGPNAIENLQSQIYNLQNEVEVLQNNIIKVSATQGASHNKLRKDLDWLEDLVVQVIRGIKYWN